MIKLQAEFKAEARKLAAECKTKGIEFVSKVKGKPDTVQGLAQCVNTLRMLIINFDRAKQLENWMEAEAEAKEIIEANSLDW